eukprot:82232-Pleurochrysis_carterae.AAC.2
MLMLRLVTSTRVLWAVHISGTSLKADPKLASKIDAVLQVRPHRCSRQAVTDACRIQCAIESCVAFRARYLRTLRPASHWMSWPRPGGCSLRCKSSLKRAREVLAACKERSQQYKQKTGTGRQALGRQ